MIKLKVKNLTTSITSPEIKITSPKWLVLGVNNLCNLHCKMCDVGTGNDETNFSKNLIGTRPIDMPIELFEKIAQQAQQYFPQVKLGYAFTEPLIYKHLEQSLQIAKAYDLAVAITTNGLKLKEKTKIIVENGVKDIYLSIDGLKDIHNHIRGHHYSFQKAIEGIEELLKHVNRPKISIFCVITEWNIGHLTEFVEFFSSYPIEYIGFMHTNFTSEKVAAEHNLKFGYRYHATHSNIEEVDLDRMDLDLLWQDIQQIKQLKTDITIGFSPELNSREMLNVFYHQPEIFIGKKCNDVFKTMMIKSDASVIPAHGRCFNLNIGNLYEQNLLSVWHSASLNKLQLDLTQSGGFFPACSRCCSAFQD